MSNGESAEQMEAGAAVTRYTATATYGGTSSTQYATGYTVTASYTGQVARTDCKVVTYTAIFGSMEAPAKVEQPQTEEATQAGAINWPLTAACVGGIGLLALGGWLAVKKWREDGGMEHEMENRIYCRRPVSVPGRYTGPRIRVHRGRPGR